MSKTTSIILSIVLTALVIGGLTYYLMSQASQADKQELESQIGELQVEVEEIESEDLTVNEKDLEAGENIYLEAKKYCSDFAEDRSDSLSDITLADFNNEYFAQCKISAGSTGYLSIAKKINNQWQELYTGNSEITADIVNKYSIPPTIYAGLVYVE